MGIRFECSFIVLSLLFFIDVRAHVHHKVMLVGGLGLSIVLKFVSCTVLYHSAVNETWQSSLSFQFLLALLCVLQKVVDS